MTTFDWFIVVIFYSIISSFITYKKVSSVYRKQIEMLELQKRDLLMRNERLKEILKTNQQHTGIKQECHFLSSMIM